MFTSCELVSTPQRPEKNYRTHVQTEVDLVSSELPDMHPECSMAVLVCGRVRMSLHDRMLRCHLHNIPDCRAIEKNCRSKYQHLLKTLVDRFTHPGEYESHCSDR
jgi:hypothetical protein